MNWLLILTLIGHHGAAIATATFDSKALCQVAARKFQEAYLDHGSSGGFDQQAICVRRSN